mmetsp:Transcript_74269/g.131338  ORF Transcript_74269/g.131338 Transcript_74269/m.131338 type:complete len:86 (+) Transcript_74269:111-368(+)
MYQPGEGVTKLAQQQSMSATFTRILQRSKGLPVPMAAKPASQNEEKGSIEVFSPDGQFGLLRPFGMTIGGAIIAANVVKVLRGGR